MTDRSPSCWRILVVDDDALIAALVGDGLRLHGHDVVVSSSPDEARLVLGDVDPHLLICDLNFTDGQSGAAFISEVRGQRPWVACVVLSNHRSPELAVADGNLLPKDVVYLVKSMVRSVDQIVDAVHAAMTGSELEASEHDDEAVIIINAAQAQVLRMLAAGATTRALAEARGTSVRAAESLLVRLYAVLGLDTSRDSNPRVEAIRLWQSGRIRVRSSSRGEASLVS
ncbi:response regulator [Microcella frigidaquae]|uniref:DNA-binding NarL/FixJ family response regulator n=1 Tax=Microcella frigidaquae TaxID=424758 RepID=A0A840X847_9MICO|nr:response regulator [Microcella frigidaquae]MBB5617374.1 DNA-binding NarL/FixJ family response regulator [Microcella frigidaquae]MCA1942192.1 response regulator [Microcella sp.]NHN45153.1 response regulator transcription factor [Microcella frigidaquae]